MNTIENNKLIAEFMGLQTGKQLGYARWHSDWFDNSGVINGQRNEKLLFDLSWDWLMPVVQKINIVEDYRFTVQIMSMDVYIHDNIKGGYVFQSECKWQCDELLSSVYEAVSEFIKRFNTQSK